MRLSLLALLCISYSFTYAQNNPGGLKSSAIQAYAIVQPVWQDQAALNSILSQKGISSLGNFAFYMGLGTQYQFRTGTSVGMEALWSTIQQREPLYALQLSPFIFSLSVRQEFLRNANVIPYLSGSVGTANRTLHYSTPASGSSSFSDQLETPNTSRLFQEQAFGEVSAGIRFRSPLSKISEYVAMETGYRFQLHTPEWHTDFLDGVSISNERFAQYFISLKAGIQMRGRKSKG